MGNFIYLEKLLCAVLSEVHSFSAAPIKETPLPRALSPVLVQPKAPPLARSPAITADSNLKIAMLENHIELLADQLKKIQDEGSVLEAKARSEREKSLLGASITDLKKEITGRDRTIAVLQNQLGQTNDQLTALQTTLEAQQTFQRHLEAVLASTSTHKDELFETCVSLENRLAMLLEDFYRFADLLEERLLLKEQLAALTSKHAKLELDIAAGNIGLSGDNAPLVHLDDPIFRVIHPHPWTPPDLKAANCPPTFPRPTYATFISKEIPTSKVDISQPPFAQWLEVTIRGIFDSKYAEHVLCGLDMMRVRHNFAEFVYAWMGIYGVDERKREVVTLDWSVREEVDARRYQLLLALTTEKAKKAWEMWTFREFLMENMDLDQLSFFLHCRHLLFRGPQLQSNSGKYAVVHYVPIAHANSLIDTLMLKLPHAERNTVKSLLLDKARNKSGVLHIDSSYVLRVFLMYYERERENKYRQIEELFQQAPKEELPDNSLFLPFFSIRQILINLNPDFTDLNLVHLYRLTWNQAGTLTPASLFSALSKSGALSLCLRLGGLWPQPVLNAYNDLETGLNPLNDIYAKVVSDWKSMSKRLDLLKEAVTRMGLLGLAGTISKCELVLKRKGQVKMEETGGRHVGEMYARLWGTLCQAGVVQMEVMGMEWRQRDERHYAEYLFSTCSDLKRSCFSFHAASHSLKVSLFTLKFAVNKIQRIWMTLHPRKPTKRHTKP